ncbi:MAG TPA: hypothetical protein VL523_11115 [Terriglobia bacterium]|nr:hypothetical protein [Terriglobia bacterium]
MKSSYKLLGPGLLVFCLAGRAGWARGGQNAAAPASDQGQNQAAVSLQALAASGKLQPADVRMQLYKIYDDAYKLGEAVGALHPEQWEFGGRKRAAFYQSGAALRAAVTDFRKPWNGFYSNPGDASQGRATVSALQALQPKVKDFMSALADSPGASQAGDYQRYAGELTALGSQLESYVSSMEAPSQPPLPSGAAAGGAPAPSPAAPASPGATPAAPEAQPAAAANTPPSNAAGGGLEPKTEEIRPAPAAAPLTGASADRPPLDPQQLKDLLYQAYVPAFRLKDMLGQEHPESWKAPDAEQTAYREASEMLSHDLADLTAWRDQLEEHPSSLEAAFEVYAALGKLSPPAGSVGRIVARYDNSKVGAEYAQRARQVAALRDRLEPYLSYLLRFHDEQVGTVQRNFTACEQELGFAMRPTTPTAVPLKNIIPEFKGRRPDRPARHSPKSGHRATSKQKKKTSKPAQPAPSH